jgi:hypothetical protein
MKTILFCILAMALNFCASAQTSTNQPSRFKHKIIAYEGKIGSGVCCSAVSFEPEDPGAVWSNTLTSPGHESELKCSFVGRNGGKDVYRFTFSRMTKVGSADRTISAKEIQFDGRHTIVFEDALHTVVMESPSAEDLKAAQKH